MPLYISLFGVYYVNDENEKQHKPAVQTMGFLQIFHFIMRMYNKHIRCLFINVTISNFKRYYYHALFDVCTLCLSDEIPFVLVSFAIFFSILWNVIAKFSIQNARRPLYSSLAQFLYEFNHFFFGALCTQQIPCCCIVGFPKNLFTWNVDSFSSKFLFLFVFLICGIYQFIIEFGLNCFITRNYNIVSHSSVKWKCKIDKVKSSIFHRCQKEKMRIILEMLTIGNCETATTANICQEEETESRII